MWCPQEIHERLESCMTLSILLSKLPEDIKLVVSRQIEGENWKLDKLLEILKIEVKARNAQVNVHDGDQTCFMALANNTIFLHVSKLVS